MIFNDRGLGWLSQANKPGQCRRFGRMARRDRPRLRAHVCFYVYMYVGVCMHVCMYARMHVWMYVTACVCTRSDRHLPHLPCANLVVPTYLTMPVVRLPSARLTTTCLPRRIIIDLATGFKRVVHMHYRPQYVCGWQHCFICMFDVALSGDKPHRWVCSKYRVDAIDRKLKPLVLIHGILVTLSVVFNKPVFVWNRSLYLRFVQFRYSCLSDFRIDKPNESMPPSIHCKHVEILKSTKSQTHAKVFDCEN